MWYTVGATPVRGFLISTSGSMYNRIERRGVVSNGPALSRVGESLATGVAAAGNTIRSGAICVLGEKARKGEILAEV